jgi:putative transposase
VKFAFIDAEKAQWPIAMLCAVLGVSSSGYYAWRRRPPSERAKRDARLAVEVRLAHKRGREQYGSPRVHRELRAHGHRIGKKRVERLMRQEGIQGQRKRRYRRTTDSNHSQPVAANVLARNFQADAPNTVWVTDVTHVWTVAGWLYLAVLSDLFSRRVVGWAISETNDRALALEALRRALAARRPAAGLVHHSDRGSPYASDDYQAALRDAGIVPSMSRSGDCWDSEHTGVCYGTAA